MGRDVFGVVHNQRPGDVPYLGNDGAWSVEGHPLYAYSNGVVSIGYNGLITGSTLYVTASKAVSHVMADFIFVNTGAGSPDSGALRAIASSVVGSPSIRAGEFQVLRGTGTTNGSGWALEVGVHTQVAGDGVAINDGIALYSNHAGWLSSGVRADSAIRIFGVDGWTHFLRCYDTDDTTVLFDIDQNGIVYASAPSGSNSSFKSQAAGAGSAFVQLVTAGAENDLHTDATGNFLISAAGVAAGVIKMTHAAAVANSLVVAAGNIQFGSGNYGVGTITSDASGNLTSVSDSRLKTPRGYVTQGHEAVMALKPRIFTWNKASGMETEHEQIGFFADEVEEVIPEAVGRNAHGDRTLNDRGLIAALINGYKEQDARIAALEAKVAQLS